MSQAGSQGAAPKGENGCDSPSTVEDKGAGDTALLTVLSYLGFQGALRNQSVTPALGRQEDQKFKDTFHGMSSSGLAWATKDLVCKQRTRGYRDSSEVKSAYCSYR